ncbi:hypothetical protein ACKWTF_014582 [Chironomus riparius]
MMKFAAISSINCFNPKKTSVILCWIDFIASILGVVAAAAFGFVGIIIINDEQQKHLIADYISQYLTVNSDVISYGLFSVTLLTLMAVFSYYFLDGVKMNEPRNLLPYTFKNEFFGIILTAYGLCFLSPLFFLGAYFILLATFNYSLFDAISLDNEEKLIKSLTSQQRTQNGKTSPAIEISSNDQEHPQDYSFAGCI